MSVNNLGVDSETVSSTSIFPLFETIEVGKGV